MRVSVLATPNLPSNGPQTASPSTAVQRKSRRSEISIVCTESSNLQVTYRYTNDHADDDPKRHAKASKICQNDHDRKLKLRADASLRR